MQKARHTGERIETITQEVVRRLRLSVRLGVFSPQKSNRASFRRRKDDPNVLLEMARLGDVDAEHKLRVLARIELTLDLAREDCKISRPVLQYLCELLRRDETRPNSRAKRGRSKRALLQRDQGIVLTVRQVCWEHGFAATRNREPSGEAPGASGCSIVADALTRLGIRMTERAVEAIWARRLALCPHLEALPYPPTSHYGEEQPVEFDGPMIYEISCLPR